MDRPNLIKNWTIVRWGNSVVVVGEIYNDSKNRFADGTSIHTSKLTHCDFEKGVVETLNSTYNLDMEL